MLNEKDLNKSRTAEQSAADSAPCILPEPHAEKNVFSSRVNVYFDPKGFRHCPVCGSVAKLTTVENGSRHYVGCGRRNDRSCSRSFRIFPESGFYFVSQNAAMEFWNKAAKAERDRRKQARREKRAAFLTASAC